MSPNAKRLLLGLTAVLFVAACVLSLVIALRNRIDKSDFLAEAIHLAKAAGSYRFTSDITQVTMPTSKVTNVGRRSRTDQLHLEGETNLRKQSTQLRIWTQQGSVSDPASGMAVKVENGRTYVQEGLGAWREHEGLTDSFAPQGDFMAFLVALRDPVAQPPEERNGIHFTRYTFRLDGLALAEYMRDLTEDLLSRRGELPTGAQLEVPAYYREMVGDGELWIDSQGLPLRQILRMRFPEQNDEVVQAEIITNFSAFGQAASDMTAWQDGGLSSALISRLEDQAPVLLAVLLVTGFCMLMLCERGRVWRSIALILIVLMIFNPLLSDLQAAQAASALAARNDSQEQQQVESRQRQDLLAKMDGPRIDPHADPLQAAGQATISLPEQAFVPLSGEPADVQAASAASWDDPTDTDLDGLTDFEEESIGTDPTYFDTDEDGITDTVEVQGIMMGDFTWYMDPNEADSNSDGISDTAEYDFNLDTEPDDSNNNGVPDVFDRDNDGDGVPDNKDLAPFTVLPFTFTANHPFELVIQQLTTGVPAFVDFQIRPVNENHLWFAYNVLDWPEWDNIGHIQDVDDGTFESTGGDMRLVPMLELRIPDGSANLPPQEDLIPYNISITALDEGETVAYVPLSVITDEETGARVAFNARMPYLPTGSWNQPHEARLVWLVQALNDLPCDPFAEEDACPEGQYRYNVAQVLQSYPDEWKLSGLNVKEDHGSSVAILYEDPAVDLEPKLDNALSVLSAGLDQVFLTGRDQDNNGQRDVNLDELVRRFHHPTNGGVSEVERWAVPNVLRVERQDYATLDEAVMSTAMTETMRILSDRFAATWVNDREIKPLLMYAQESENRSLGLDALNQPGAWVRIGETELIINFHPSGQVEGAPLLLTANLKWTPYCSPDSASPQWSPCATDEWWTTLEARHAGTLPDDPVGDSQVADGRTMIMNIYASVLMQGISSVVSVNDIIEAENNAALRDDSSLRDLVQTVLEKGNDLVVKSISNSVLMERFKLGKTYSFVRHMGDTWKAIKTGITEVPGNIKSFYKDIKYGTLNREVKTSIVKIGIIVAVAVGYIVFQALQGVSFVDSITFALKAFGPLVGALMEAVSTYNTVMKFMRIGATSTIRLGSVQTILQSARGAAVIGAIIGALITWGFFIWGIIADHVQVFSQEFNQALAETIAATIYLIIMMVLAFSVIGSIIAVILALIDGLLTLLCETGIAPGLKRDGVCFTIGGTIIKALVYFLYNFAPMVDPTREDLLVLGSPNLTLSNQDLGLVDSNSLQASMPFTTTVHHRIPNPAEGVLIYPYGWAFFTPSNLASSTISATLTSPTEVDFSVSRGQMSHEWQVEKDGNRKWGFVPMYRGTAQRTARSGAIDLTAGVNRDIPIHLNFAYALPAYECWGIPFLWFVPIPVCYVRTLRENSSFKLNTFQLDILPATLDGFMAMGPKGPHESAPYGQSWDQRFTGLPDADGDGSGMLDPNDLSWDTDSDGLSDAFELTKRQSGVLFDERQCDADQDGLTDLQESRFGTAPNLADSDHDGLPDGEEVIHERFYYDSEMGTCSMDGGLQGGWWVQLPSGYIRVQSDPLMVDSDGDGAKDVDERAWAETPGLSLDLTGHPFHPAVPNVPWLSVVVEAEPDMLRPETSLVLTTTVETNVKLDPSRLDLFLPLYVAGDVTTYMLPFDPLTFTDTQKVTVSSGLNVMLTDTSWTTEIQSQVTGMVAEGSVITTTDTIVVTGSAAILIDAEAPRSQIDSLSGGLYLQGSANSPTTIIIGGSAGDNLTGIDRVDINVNGGAEWLPVDGAEIWTYPLTIGDGSLSLRTRAADGAGNVEAEDNTIIVHADGLPPVFDFQYTPTHPVVPGREASGTWTVELGGSISDPDLLDGSASGSGVDPASLLVRLRSTSSAAPVIGEWQPAETAEGLWSLVYRFPANIADPTGTWIAEMLASDKVGNNHQAENPNLLYVDSAPPEAKLDTQILTSQVLTGTLTLSGVLSDTLSGVDQLDVSFTPLEQVAPLSDAVLWLSFDEQESSTYWADRSGHDNTASCVPSYYSACPFTGQLGVIGGGLTLQETEGREYVSVADADELDFPAGTGFSVQTWFKHDGYSYGSIVDKDNAYSLGIGESPVAYWSLYGADSIWGGPDLTDGQWYHIVGTFDPQVGEETGKMQLYVNGQLVGERSAPNDLAYDSEEPLKLGHYHLEGVIDEVIVSRHALSAEEVQALYQAGTRTWHPATLTQHGSGIAQTTWSLPVPAGLEGIYQIDLRGRDVLGNNRVIANLWRGIIDTWAPRLSLSAVSNGAVYIDPTTTERRVGARYVCAAIDTYLDESSLQCPGTNLPPPLRLFDQDPILQGLFPDLTLNSGLVISWTQWQPPGVFSALIGACDVYGNCATETPEFAIDLLPVPGPAAAVVVPTDKAIIGSDGTIDVTVAANAPDSLRTVTLALDGTIVDTANFSIGDALVFNQRVVTISASEGPHTLLALASDWEGNAQIGGFPVHFTLDTNPPQVAISTTMITQDEVYHKGSPILLFHGTASDTLCLAAVQLRVDSGPFIQAYFEDGYWSVAYYVNAPEGQTLTVTARATDCAGQITETTRIIGTDLSEDYAPDTLITSTPDDLSGPSGVTFEFQANKGDLEVAGLLCRLDDAVYTPCASPYVYDGLSSGQHTFYVRAIDVEGNVDETPGIFTWKVIHQTWLPLIIHSPSSYRITGKVTVEGMPLSGVTVTASGGSKAVTDAGGIYSLNLPPGSHILTPSKQDYAFSPVSRSITLNQNISNQDFTARLVHFDAVENGGFETRDAWELPLTTYPASYSTAKAHSGTYSVLTGIVNPTHNQESFSSVRQAVTIPSDAYLARLSLWIYPLSSESPMQSLPGMPEFSGFRIFGLVPLANDAQYILILDQNDQVIKTLLWQRSNSKKWSLIEFDLLAYAGKTIKIQIGSYNDGYTGNTAMYVDDVSVEVFRK